MKRQIRDEKIRECKNKSFQRRNEEILKRDKEIQMLKEEIETPKCIVCWDMDVSMVFTCGHAITCEGCASKERLAARGWKCFNCNKSITATKLYY